MNNKELLARSANRYKLAAEVSKKEDNNDLFGKPTPAGESMMLHTRQCPECQVGQAGPVPGKPGFWQCPSCGSVYQAAKGSPAEQLPYDAKFYGAGGALIHQTNTPHRNVASDESKLVRKGDYRGAVSQFIVDIRDAINGNIDPDSKDKVERVLNAAFNSGDLNISVDEVYRVISPVEDVEVTSEGM